MDFEITQPDGKRHLVSVDKPIVVIGRGSRCEIQLDSDVVSSKHVRFKTYRNYIALEDLGSTNGTFVNGARLEGDVEISCNDTIELGPSGPVVQLIAPGQQQGSMTPGGESSGVGALDSSSDGAKPKSHTKYAVAVTVASVLALGLSCVICSTGAFVTATVNGNVQTSSSGADSKNTTTEEDSSSDAKPHEDAPASDPSNDGAASSVSSSDAPVQTATFVESSRDEENLAKSVGLVISGYELRSQDGSAKTLPVSIGSAFAISPNGHLLTNEHVVKPGDEQVKLEQKHGFKPAQRRVWCVFDGQISVAAVLHVSDDFDLSILKVDRQDIPVFRIANTNNVERATDVYALGFPGAAQDPISEEEKLEEELRHQTLHTDIRKFFKTSDFDYVLTKGIVSKIRDEGNGRRYWIQHNAQVNPGNSGGPLCLEDGTVVGINTLSLTHDRISGIFFSVSMMQLRDEIDRFVPAANWIDLE